MLATDHPPMILSKTPLVANRLPLPNGSSYETTALTMCRRSYCDGPYVLFGKYASGNASVFSCPSPISSSDFANV